MTQSDSSPSPQRMAPVSVQAGATSATVQTEAPPRGPQTDPPSIAAQAEAVLAESPCTKMIDCPCGCNKESTVHLFDELPDDEVLYDVADLFKAFSDTTRIKILFALMGKSLCVADLAAAVNCTQSAVSHQLRILKQARLVRFQRDGKNVFYSLADDHVFTMLAQGITHICE